MGKTLPKIAKPAKEMSTSNSVPGTEDVEILKQRKLPPKELHQSTLIFHGRTPTLVQEEQVRSASHPVYGKYFELTTLKDGTQKLKCIAERKDTADPCTSILSILPNSNSCNLKKHLELPYHGIQFSKEKAKSSLPALQNLFPGMMRTKYKRNDHQQVTFDQSVTDMIAVDGLPLNFVANPGFRNLILKLDPKLHVKSRQAYVKQITNAVANDVQPSLVKELSQVPEGFCHFSCDVWSSKRREGILGVLAHFITEDFVLVSRNVAIKQLKNAHTGQNIQQSFGEVLNKYGKTFETVGFIVTDNASSMIKAFDMTLMFEIEDDDEQDDVSEAEDESSDEDVETSGEITSEELLYEEDVDARCESELYDFEDDFTGVKLGHHGCVAHKLQLVINDALKRDMEAMLVLNYVRKVMVFFKRSTKWTDRLRELTKLDVTLPGRTRWNSLLIMLDRFQDEKFVAAVKDVLRDAESSAKSSPEPPSHAMLQKTKELHKILRPFGDATDKLQSSGLTANWVILSIFTAFYRVRGHEVEHFKDLKTMLLMGCKERLEKVVNQDEFVCATLLDPSQKADIFNLGRMEPYKPTDKDIYPHLVLVTEEHAVGMLQHQFLKECTRSGQNPAPCISETENHSNSNPSPRKHSMLDILKPVRRIKALNTRDTEVTVYLKEDPLEDGKCVLTYWREKAEKFPILSTVARKILSIPATSGGVERLFSITGSLARARRACLRQSQLENMILLRQHRRPVLLKRLQQAGKLLLINRKNRKRHSHS